MCFNKCLAYLWACNFLIYHCHGTASWIKMLIKSDTRHVKHYLKIFYRKHASKKVKYESVKLHADLCKHFSEQESQFNSCEWQLDVAEALLLGTDSVVIVGTGSGKTIPFMLLLVLNSKKMVLIISPLKVLQHDQVCPSAYKINK